MAIYLPDGSQPGGGTGDGITVCTSTTKPSSPSEGDVIYVTDNTAGEELEAYDGAAWQTVGSGGGGVSDPMTTYLNMGGQKIYLYKGATDALSVYLEADTTNSRLNMHVPTGYDYNYLVG